MKRRTPRAIGATMTPRERKSMLKPRSGASDVAHGAVRIWKSERRLYVDDVTPAKLARLARQHTKLLATEAARDDAHARRMQPLRDARLRAGDALWRAILDLNATIRRRARTDPDILVRFAALIASLRSPRRARAAE